MSSWIAAALAIDDAYRDLLGRSVAFMCAFVLVLAIRPLRASARQMLRAPIPSGCRLEVALVAIAKLPLMLGIVGATAWWIWLTEGSAALASRMDSDPMNELREAFSLRGVLFFLVLGGIVGPIVEELVFRGFLYNAWERRWGWVPAMIGVSTLFALYHPSFFTAFASSVLFVCVRRRTGSLWAPIIVHGVGNISLWYPLAGGLLRPSRDLAVGDISSWGLHLACLVVSLVALPIYIGLARERPIAETVWLER